MRHVNTNGQWDCEAVFLERWFHYRGECDVEITKSVPVVTVRKWTAKQCTTT